jgi:hypothetical protein
LHGSCTILVENQLETTHMSDPFEVNPLLIDGYSGLPADSQAHAGPRHGTVEWLLESIERHAAAEADSLALYEQIRQESGDPVVALVMGLILEDEERHHGLLRRIEASLRDALNWTHSASALPAAPPPGTPQARALAAVARDLVAEERTGAHAMHELARSEKGIDAGLDSLLLEMMAMDSEKHARLLEFVRDRLARRSAS